MRRSWPALLRQVLPVAVAIGIWQGISGFFLPVYFPGPVVLVERMIAIYGSPASYAAIGATLAEILQGFVIAMIVGAALGLVMGLKPLVEIFFDSWIMVLLTFPAVCWAFLSVLWFGLSGAAPVMTIVLIVIPFVVMNIWEGTKAIETELVEMGQVYKAARWLMLRKVLGPQLLPYIFSSLRISLSLSWKVALVAEAFGAGSGVGQQLMYWFQDTRVYMMLAWGVSFMIIMVLIDLFGFRLWARRSFAWRQQFAT